ncbi:hypothetical protein SAMN04488498_12440 [Mesorhizobium albiziae]|uniref:Uncharacterized protein n=1 Tax=Neomesorhizobium albiziae TaxID=335020 RepID=A0A1I4E9W1_9HYPH|nr:hypothetical protein [Mesorhizobium albiziae]GLS31133.1 hypothetical protein GCM10007937_28420 [Mesorhizobium albiziae]SFL02604.1 hypothetical protein SAMN04488498_12440 [Mesorhizobium albiziae]
MPSITDKNTLRIFASASDGPTVCLALKDFEAGDGDSLVLIHSPGAAEVWRRIELPFDIMDVALTSDPQRRQATYMALASTGEAVVLTDPPVVSRVNAEGVFRVIEPGKGMLSALNIAGGSLLALGRGGQAYRFGSEDGWQAVSPVPPLEDNPTDHINFLCAGASAGGGLYFGGVSEPQTKSFDEIVALLTRGDVEGFANRIITDVRRNYGTLWLLAEGAWRKVDLPASGTVTNLFEWEGGRLFLSTNSGLVAEIVAADQVEELYVSGEPKEVADLVGWQGQPMVVLTDEIVTLDLEAGTSENLPVPDGFEALQNLHPDGDRAWLVDWLGLARWNGSDWGEVEIPRALLR